MDRQPIRKNVLITGSTGMIGSIVLRECLNSSEIDKVVSIVRKTSGVKNPKLKELIHDDYLNFSDVEKYFSDIDIAFFCIGVYTGQVPDHEFKKITVDFAKSFADCIKKNSPTVTFCFLSGQGADPNEKSRMSFAKYKGMAENYLISKKFMQLYIFRPGYIYPSEKRKEPNFSYRLMRSLYPVVKKIYPKGVITSENLGKAIFKVGISGAEKMILENRDIKRV